MIYSDLLDRLVNLKALALLPDGKEKCFEFSSNDRRSRYDENSGESPD